MCIASIIILLTKERFMQSRLNVVESEAFTLKYGDVVTFRGTDYSLTAKVEKRAGFEGEWFYENGFFKGFLNKIGFSKK